MILPSKTIPYTLAGASLVCAVLLTAMYGAHVPIHTLFAKAETIVPGQTIDGSHITAKAAIIYDPLTKKILFEKNADERLPLASLTKLMAAEAVLSLGKNDESIQITQADLRPSGDWGLKVGETWKLSDLLTFGLVASSNDAMAAAASALGADAVDHMNQRAKELGLTQTYFYNPTGLDLDLETAGAYGSAHDVAILASNFLMQHAALFEATIAPSVSISSNNHTLEATSTAVPLLDIPGLIGAKTGYTDLAGGNLVAAVDLQVGHPLIIAVLGSTHEGRFEDVKTLISEARKSLLNQP
jgi:D-alanyl-D-alanine carboxypeptidase